ncbi:hypothetical protein QBC35DRAFT_534028 [Podospora australis]|uniref:DUF7708 domain-containing protein n=1 Tax=Podospora australis TaxID=1536484 RepID=A0AAN7AFQ2_9PEZI|nr:hypothetical protein QBC35DRAFT_534028 [Podospora australis]
MSDPSYPSDNLQWDKLTPPGLSFNLSSIHSDQLAKHAFEEARQLFQSIKRRPENPAYEETATIEDLLASIEDAKRVFARRRTTKAWKWITRLSSKIAFYGQSILNHETLVKEVSKALCRICEAVQNVKIRLLLFPSPSMKELVVELYTHMMKSASRAIQWYNEPGILQMMSAVARPFPLRFKDIVDDILDTGRRIDALAVEMSEIEQRRIRLDLAEALKELKVTQEMSVLPSPEQSRHYYSVRRNLRRGKFSSSHQLQRSPILHAWGEATDSTQILVHAAGSIDRPITPADVLKYLTSQVLKQNHRMLNERSMSLNAARYQSATTEKEWFTLLASALDGGLSQIYVVIDLDIVARSGASIVGWLSEFARLYQVLRDRGTKTVVRTAFISPGRRSELMEVEIAKVKIGKEQNLAHVSTFDARKFRSRKKGGRWHVWL